MALYFFSSRPTSLTQFSPPCPDQFDMTACAADDHLSVIATAATSDGGIESTKPSDRYTVVVQEKGETCCRVRAVLD